MISRFTKIQLIIFAFVTVLGAAFVGGRYAQVDRFFIDRSYPVTAIFPASGGIFAGAQVTYRGIAVGKVGKLSFVDAGVEARLDIENSAPKIPDDVEAVVANKSAIGEQFVDLQPKNDSRPYLASGSRIPLGKTRIPLATNTLLIDLNSLVKSVDTDSLRTLVDELGQAFEGTGSDLTRIVDTSSEFIQSADDNIGVTRQLIRDSSGVLQTQIDKQGQLATFSKNLSLLSDTLVDADPDLRRLLDQGTPSARLLRTVVDENYQDLTSIFANLRTATKPFDTYHKGVQAVFILYPYLLEGGYSVIAPSKLDQGEYDATFGLVLTPENEPSRTGYGSVCRATDPGEDEYRVRRDPDELQDIPFNVGTDCENQGKVARNPSRTDFNLNRAGAASVSGKDSWKWLLLGPASN